LYCLVYAGKALYQYTVHNQQGSIMPEIDIKRVVQQLDELAVDIRVLNLEHGFTSEFNVSRLTASMLNVAGKLDNIQKQIEEQK
jgi:hypothetical protein